MNYVNYNEAYSNLVAHGFLLDGGLEVGRMMRVKRSGHTQKGWYILHAITLDDGQQALIGSFGYWEGAEKYSEKVAPGKEHKLNKEQLEAMKAAHAEATRKAEYQRREAAERASQQATKAWYAYVTEGESPYFVRKGVRAHNVRFAPAGNGTVAIPMRDTKGKIHGLQIIRGKDRGSKLEKEYWPKGLDKKGHFHVLGSITPQTGIILLGEGYATMATAHQASDYPSVVAFDAGNLSEVAKAIHKEYPRAKILILADDDYLTDGNPGCKYAEAAAISVGGAWIKPLFPASRENKKLTDFNDLANFPNCSESTVMVQIEDAIQSLGWGSYAARMKGGQASDEGGGVALKGTLKGLLTVEEAVQRYSLIYGAGGTMYDHQEFALVPKSDVLDICVDHAWGQWKPHPLRSVVRLAEVGFDPTGKDKSIICNLWGGWPTQPKKGNCDNLLELLYHLCGQEKEADTYEVYSWVLKWLALPIQKPGAKMKTALIFHGLQGVGKNLFFEAYAQIYGKYSRIVGQAEIDDKFNDWASGKLFMIADEVVARQELFHIKNKLKALITGETIRINPKNVSAHDERNHVNIVFLSNERQPLVLEEGDRRYAVIWVPEVLNPDYYARIAEEIANGGIEALHDYLLNLPMDGFNEHSKPPMTKAKRDLININRESTERFIEEWLNGDLGLPVCPVKSLTLYKSYLDWCRKNGVSKPRESNQFMGYIDKISGWDKKRFNLWDNYNHLGQRKKTMVVIPDQSIISHDKQKTADQDESQWVSDCCLDLENALKEGKN